MSPLSAVTVITGAGDGIGRAAALQLAQRGDRVLLIDRDAVAIGRVADEVSRAGGRAMAIDADVRDGAAMGRAVDAAREAWGGVTYLFSNAGIGRRGRVAELSLDDWDAVIETNVTGAFHACRAVIPAMVEAGSGAIVINASDFAVIGEAGYGAYTAAKSALLSLAKSLALEFARDGLRVNAVGPGPIDTAHLRGGREGAEWHEAVARYRARIPMGRLGRTGEVASVVAFLLSDRASYVTAQLVQPNGGQVMW